MAINCNEINQIAAELKMKFEAGMALSANDLDLLVELTLSTRDCSGEVVSIDSSHYKQPLETITDLTNLNYLLLTDKQRHYVKSKNIDYFWDSTATSGDQEPFDKDTNTLGYWINSSLETLIISDNNKITGTDIIDISALTTIYKDHLLGAINENKAKTDSNETIVTDEITRASIAEQLNTTAIAEEVTRATAAEEANETAIAGLTTGYLGDIIIADVFTTNGIYTPTEEGTYTNAGGLTFLPSTTDIGFDVKFSLFNSVWTKLRVDLNITFDAVPTLGSPNAVTSDGISIAISANATNIDNLEVDVVQNTNDIATKLAKGTYTGDAQALKNDIDTKQDALTFDTEPLSGSDNPVTGHGIFTALQNISGGTGAIEIDTTPTEGSTNAVESGGVADAIEVVSQTLQGNIDTEIADRAADVDDLTSQIDNEISERASVDTYLQSLIAQKASRVDFEEADGINTAFWKPVLGIDNVNNTLDVDKPVSTAQQLAINAKQDTLVLDSVPTEYSVNATTSGSVYTQYEYNSMMDVSNATGGVFIDFNSVTNIFTIPVETVLFKDNGNSSYFTSTEQVLDCENGTAQQLVKILFNTVALSWRVKDYFFVALNEERVFAYVRKGGAPTVTVNCEYTLNGVKSYFPEIDTTPTEGSTNAVESGGVADAIEVVSQTLQGNIDTEIADRAAADTNLQNQVDVNSAKATYPNADAIKLIGIEYGAEVNTINSTVTGEPTGASVVLNMVSLTQAEYDAGTPIATTIYIING